MLIQLITLLLLVGVLVAVSQTLLAAVLVVAVLVDY
jgi:hypothetical protein